METPEELLLGTLRDLGAEDFKTFKWFLQKNILKSFPTIPKSKLENADRVDTVDLMVQTYDTDIIQVTTMVLEKMKMNDLVKNLSPNSSEPAETSTETGAAAGPSSGTEDVRPGELDLRYHHPGLDHDGQLKAHLKKYFCKLIPDLRILSWPGFTLSEDNRKVTCIKKRIHLICQDWYDLKEKQLCLPALNSRSYWEVEWSGDVRIAVIKKGNSFMEGDETWNLKCANGHYSGYCNNTPFPSPAVPMSSSSGRLAVYVDCPAGSLSFYEVSSDKLRKVFSFNDSFTEPLYAGFMLLCPGSSVFLCDV